jgi:hypothetical protein
MEHLEMIVDLTFVQEAKINALITFIFIKN